MSVGLISLIVLGLGIHILFIMLQGRRYPLKFDRVDLAFVLLALCASALTTSSSVCAVAKAAVVSAWVAF